MKNPKHLKYARPFVEILQLPLVCETNGLIPCITEPTDSFQTIKTLGRYATNQKHMPEQCANSRNRKTFSSAALLLALGLQRIDMVSEVLDLVR